jgi:radical SAM superfamily enzyme YgiQ (UPF0313 family)
MDVLLISTYDLGRQPFGLASPAAWLRQAGLRVACADVSRQTLSDEAISRSGAIGFYLPMHTATRAALPLIARAREVNPGARLCAYGLYASLNEAALRAAGVGTILGAEFEDGLVAWARSPAPETGRESGFLESEAPGRGSEGGPGGPGALPRLRFRVPDRTALPPLSRYAALQMPDGTRRTVGYTEASRGCKHLCRHCPIVPIYNGRFRVVARDVVLDDVAALVEAGARHITFGDPDFFNGIGHARELTRAFARRFPGMTYDVTIKIEHLLRHSADLPALVETGCLFVTSAVESVDDAVLERLDKGHTRRDFFHALARCRELGLYLCPTFIPFTPWTTVKGFRELLSIIASLDLVEHVSPIQLAIRLLVTNGSRVLELADVREIVQPFDPQRLVYPWRHPDPRVDRLHAAIQRTVQESAAASRIEIFRKVWRLAYGNVSSLPGRGPLRSRAAIPYLTEPWYC